MGRIRCRARAYTWLRAIITACLALAVVGVATAHAQTFAADYFGISGGFDPSDTAALATVNTEGIGVLRMDAPWASAEPTAPAAGQPATYTWTGLDATATALAQQGIRWYPILDAPPTWDSPVPSGSVWGVPDTAGFAAYAEAFAARYGAGGSFWAANPQLPQLPVQDLEIWNEENNPTFWPGGADPAQFFTLYSAARQAIHAVQPNAMVVFGGLLDCGTDAIGWVQTLVREVPGAFSQIDAVGYHPYLHAVSQIESRVAQLRALMDANGGASVPIEINEFDSNIGFESTSAWAQALSTVVVYLATSDCGISRIMPFQLQTATGTDSSGWFSLFSAGGVPTPIGSAYFSAIAQARAATTTDHLCGIPPRSSSSGSTAALAHSASAASGASATTTGKTSAATRGRSRRRAAATSRHRTRRKPKHHAARTRRHTERRTRGR